MSLYTIALFLHIVGVLLLAITFTAEGISLSHLRRAQTSAEVNDWQRVAGLGRVFGPASVLAILGPGLYMTITSWGWAPWIVAGSLAWLLIAVMGAINGIRLGVASRNAAADVTAMPRLRAPSFVLSWWTRVALALGVVFVMSTKPGLLGASLTLVVAAAAGVAAGTVSVSRSPAIHSRTA